MYQRVFLDDLRAQNLSPRTAETYGEALSQFETFLIESSKAADPAAVTADDVRAFTTHLIDTRSASTAHNRYRALNRFFNYLVEQEELKASPMAKLKPPKLEEKLVPVLKPQELGRLLDHLNGKDFESRRDRAIFSVLIDSGLRLSELADVRMTDDPLTSDVDLEQGTIRVVGKGNRERLISVGRKAKADLNRYLIAREREPHADLPWLWLARKGRFTNNGIYQMVARRGREIGLDINPHQFRHTFAHAWLAQGGSENDLMRLTGWRSRTMLMRYGASAGAERALEANRRLSARDRL